MDAELLKELTELRKMYGEQVSQNARLMEQLSQLMADNKLLNQKLQILLKQKFGRKSEQLSPDQLELLLQGLDQGATPEDDDPPPSTPGPSRKKRTPSKPRLPEDLPTETIQLDDPEVVQRDPNAYKCIGKEVTVELDVIPTQYVRRLLVRRKFKNKHRRDHAPLIAPLPPRLIDNSIATAGLVTDIVIKKYQDHLPLYRQEQILRTRFGIHLSRKTMTDWVDIVADWLKPIYDHIREDLRQSAYLQADETPVRYCRREGGGSGQGYLWVYHHPGGNVLYEWHTSRAALCLEGMLGTFSGTVQSDGYSAYTSYAKSRKDIDLAGCWAHVRRKFHEASEESPAQAGWVLNQIAQLYRVERDVRGLAPVLRQTRRASHTTMVVERLFKALQLKMADTRPKSAIGKAIRYALALWPQLVRFLDDGMVEIDNNLVENAIRPTAIGKKNYLFFGHPDAGQRSAIIYTLIESCKRHGINPHEYLKDVLSRLPSMTNHQTHTLTPTNWLAEKNAAQAA